MNNKVRKIAFLLFICIFTTLFVGCSGEEKQQVVEITPMEVEEVYSFSFDYIGGKDVMPIMGYYGPTYTWESWDGNAFPDYFTDEYFEMIADAGINLLFYSDADYSLTPDLVKESLELADKYNMGYGVKDSYVSNFAGQENLDPTVIGERIAEYADYPAFVGMMIVDEPTSPIYQPISEDRFISRYGSLIDLLRNDLKVTQLNAILPMWDYTTEGMTDKYEQYIKEYCDTFDPEILIYDHYPFGNKEGIDVYFWNADIIRKYANEYKIPFGTCPQAGGQWNDEKIAFDSEPYYPTEGQFYWNTTVMLAMGSKFIDYFPVIQPVHYAYSKTEPWDFQRNGLIGTIGNKTQWHSYAKIINAHIAAVDEVLMNSVNKGIIVNGSQAKKDTHLVSCVIESGQFQELVSVKGDTLIGCFNYYGKTALYVVNYDTEYAQKITLGFNKEHNIQKIQNTETSYIKGETLELDMAAGEGVLLVIE